MAYRKTERDSSQDHAKRKILEAQENYKIGVPALGALLAVAIALNVCNAVYDFFSVYVCVIVNVALLAALLALAVKLVRDNALQREMFEQLRRYSGGQARGAKTYASYVEDSEGALAGAGRVMILETEEAYLVYPVFDGYRRRLFSRYNLTGDFGRLSLPRPEFGLREEDGRLEFVSGSVRFIFQK